MPYKPERIVSGGQTGADRSALDFAIEHGIPHGGFCPKGRKAEDGAIPPQYHLIQTPSADYRERTEANVKASDATLIFVGIKMGRGSKLTQKLCEELGKPFLLIQPSSSTSMVQEFLAKHDPRVLNVAGSRASTAPDIYKRVQDMLEAVIAV